MTSTKAKPSARVKYKPWQRVKPHSQDACYRASLPCVDGGWVVLYRQWRVVHWPSGIGIEASSEPKGREIMKAWANGGRAWAMVRSS